MIRNRVILLIFLASLLSCNTIRKIGFKPEDTDFVKNCREDWTYSDLKDTISIRLLLHDKKGRYDLVSWPNLFIGITNQNDTIGLIDNFTTIEYKVNSKLTFVPYDYGTEIEKALGGYAPVFTVHRKDKENRLYCSIKSLYYCKLIDK
ncbi:hypothetical protein [Mangrovibacterium lignilyticum]|uniref:hypothetical protein n=1 Tax=Mangrovibacterium lignilyticum TaxID=2668052 RepID=UPI0013D740EE|nr:hypothetical protein [Mangrovibacterium lignilyticum]